MDKNSIISQLNRQDIDRLRGYRERLDFYHGRQWLGRERRGEKRLTFNYAKVFIDKVTSYLMSGVNFAVDAIDDSAEAETKAKKAEAALHQVYEENSLEQLDLETEIDCAVLGDAAYKISWDTEAKKVRVTAPDVQGIYAWWLGDDTSRVWRVASKYGLTAEESQFLYGVKPKGKTATIVELWSDGEFQLYLDDGLIEQKPNPYGFIPFIIYPNLREPKQFWGVSDLEAITESQQELNRAMSQLSRILELSGNPIAVLENVEEAEDISVRPGAVWNIPEDAKAYLLDLLQGGGVNLHIDYINLLYRIMHDISESPRAAFGGTERDLSGVATVYDGDWNLFVTGRDNSDNFKLWTLVYGDGGDIATGNWSELKEFAAAPTDGDFEYRTAFMDKPDVFRCFFVESFSGNQSYSRPGWSYAVPGSKFIDNLWHEPVPFNLDSQYGLAMAHYGDYCWLSSPCGVWRAGLAVQSLDLSADILSLREELGPTGGSLTVELRNDDGGYAAPGQGDLSVLDIGGQLDFSPGYVTAQGNEVSPGLAFILDSYEHASAGGQSSLVLNAADGWNLIKGWRARHQFRWNKDSQEMNVRQILAFILGRVGLRLEVKSQSSVMAGYYPDFTINPGNSGDTIIRKLLSFVPDVLFIEGNTAWVVNPLAADDADYGYGPSHPVVEGRYRQTGWGLNRIQVEGYDPAEGEAIVVDTFSWGQIDRLYDKLGQVEDRNLDTVAKAGDRGEAYLRQAEMEAVNGAVLAPVNCGQQLYDVVDITDSRAGLEAAKRRVIGLTLVYRPRRGEYQQRLLLGGV